MLNIIHILIGFACRVLFILLLIILSFIKYLYLISNERFGSLYQIRAHVFRWLLGTHCNYAILVLFKIFFVY